MTRSTVLLVALALAGCRDEKCDQFEPARCDGNALTRCNEPIKMFHDPPYRTTTDCKSETCVQVGKQARCVRSPIPCDPTTAPQRVADTGAEFRGIEVETCTLAVGDKMFYEVSDRTKCDPKAFVASCKDADATLTCQPFPAPNLPGLHVQVVTACEGATPTCRTGQCVP